MAADLNVKIDVSDALAALKALEDASTKQKVAEKAADDVVLPALSEKEYPPQSGKKYPWKSAKQRAFVIAAIRRGDITVPYSRSGATGASYQKQPIPDGITVISGKPSAAYTRGGGPEQAAYHKGNWDTHEQLADKLEQPAALAATAALVEIIGDAGP